MSAGGLLAVRISATIANEYSTRGVFGGDEEWPMVPDGAGVHQLPRKTVQAMLADAEFNGCSRTGPDEMPVAIGNAYRALAKQLQALLAQPVDPMTNAQRQAQHTARRLASGLVRFRKWLHPDDVQAMHDHAAKLAGKRARQAAGAGSTP